MLVDKIKLGHYPHLAMGEQFTFDDFLVNEEKLMEELKADLERKFSMVGHKRRHQVFSEAVEYGKDKGKLEIIRQYERLARIAM